MGRYHGALEVANKKGPRKIDSLGPLNLTSTLALDRLHSTYQIFGKQSVLIGNYYSFSGFIHA